MPSLGILTNPRSMLNSSIRMRGCKKAHQIPRADLRYRLVISLTTRAYSNVANRAHLRLLGDTLTYVPRFSNPTFSKSWTPISLDRPGTCFSKNKGPAPCTSPWKQFFAYQYKRSISLIVSDRPRPLFSNAGLWRQIDLLSRPTAC